MCMYNVQIASCIKDLKIYCVVEAVMCCVCIYMHM